MNQIINSDCVDGMKTLESNSVDLIVTSPPYDDIRTYKGYTLDLHAVCEQAHRVLKDGGMMCMVIQDGTKDFAKSCTTYRVILDCVDNIGFKLFENVIYKKDGRPGAWWNKRFRVDHEYILMFLKGERPKYFDKEPLKVKAKHAGVKWQQTTRQTDGTVKKYPDRIQGDMKCRGTIWHYNNSSLESRESDTLRELKCQHPATFPDKLAEDLILCFSNENDVVMDPFMGSGTTAVMAKKNKRQYIGFEISKEYCEIIDKRLTAQTENLF